MSRSDIELWRNLNDTNDALRTPFLTFPFVQAAASTFYEVRVCTISRDGRPVGFFPFQFSSPFHRALGIGQRIAGELSDYFGIVAEPSLVIEPRDLLHLSNLNAMMFSHLDETQNDFGLRGEAPEVGHRIEFPDGGAAYWKAKKQSDKKFTSDTERRERKLTQECGPIRFTFREADWLPALEHLIAAKREQYARTRVADALQSERTVTLLRQLGALDDAQCRGVLSTLRAGDTWVASHFGLLCDKTLHYWFPVYNPKLTAFAPGRLLLKAILDTTEEHGLERIDRGAGDTVAKRNFSTSQHHFFKGLWTRSNPVSFAYQVGLSARWRLKSRLERATVRES